MVCGVDWLMFNKMGKALKENLPKSSVFIQKINLKEESAGCYQEEIYR